MDDKNIRKISKKELLEILLSQARRIEELELELKKCNEKLESKKLTISEVGSLAEASLKLNGVFEAAQETVDQYMLNVKERCQQLENDTKRKCQKRKREADEYFAQMESKVEELAKTKGRNGTKNTDKVNVKKKLNKGKSGKSFKRRKVTT